MGRAEALGELFEHDQTVSRIRAIVMTMAASRGWVECHRWRQRWPGVMMFYRNDGDK